MDFDSGGETSFEEVETLLESDLENFDNELEALYNRMQRYSRTADVMESADRPEDAEYFRETLAVDAYDSFVQVIQMKKNGDDYQF